MSNLNQSLEQYRDNILKAEIGALLFNLGKTHIGFWKKKHHNEYFNVDKQVFKSKFGYKVFSGYKDYYNNQPLPFETDLDKFKNLKDFILGQNQKVNLPFKVKTYNKQKENEILWQEVFKGKSSKVKFIQNVFFNGCENINSGIDKGSPAKQLEPPLWLSNAFGSFKHRIEEEDFDDARIEFFRNFDNFLQSNNFYQSPNWQEIGKFVFEKVKPWYSRLLSDSRYPVNDVSLWDQAYMTASMFKAVLSNLILDNSKLQSYQDIPSSIKWRVLGIQYDKLGLAEKGFKPTHIYWYRDISKEIDDKVKQLLEYVYPIGNEVYRDETGIYFTVGEDLGEDKDDLAILKNDLNEIREKILEIFKEKSTDEFYPTIFLTKASRGLMNLTYLLEKARENFLKSDWGKKELDICPEKSLNGRAIGVCQVCRQRLVFENDKKIDDKNICKVCYEEKTKDRVDKWLKDTSGETIWTSELKDKNDRLALVVMKFELMDWLSGNLLNSEVLNITNWNELNVELKASLKDKYYYLKKIENDTNYKNLTKTDLFELKNEINGLKSFIDNNRKTFKDFDIKQKPSEERKSDNEKEIFRKYLPFSLSEEVFNYYNQYKTVYDYYEIIFFGSVIGTEWEKFIKKQPIDTKIDWSEEKIKWEKLDGNDIDFLSTLLLQLLLRKNPSPARLRRIWESTQEFFKEIEEKFLSIVEIPDKRTERLYWIKKDINGNIDSGEYYDEEAEFWVDSDNVYLISYLKDNSKKSFRLKKRSDGKDTGIKLEISSANIQYYRPYMSIIDPTPISWQFIIPAEYVPALIKKTQTLYDKYFKYVYGKLPLHIGVIIQEYKKPLYVGINALRKIRRDVENKENLWEDIVNFKYVFKEKEIRQKIEKEFNNPLDYYSLYFGSLNNGDYKFYIRPKDEAFYWLKNVNNLQDNEKIEYIPNTFDFEFLDTNTRRNDIYYDENSKNYNKRKIDLKNNRPYNIEKHFKVFEAFKKAFGEVTSTSKLHNIINIFYEKVISEDELYDEIYGTEKFLASAMINILEPNESKRVQEFIEKWLDIKDGDKITQEKITSLITKEKIKMFLDMFEFWHKALKEV